MRFSAILLGETEYRQLGEHELSLCRKACAPGGTAVQDLGKAVLQPLYKKGLIYLAVPISPTDHISIPPLEVSPFSWSLYTRAQHELQTMAFALYNNAPWGV